MTIHKIDIFKINSKYFAVDRINLPDTNYDLTIEPVSSIDILLDFLTNPNSEHDLMTDLEIDIPTSTPFLTILIDLPDPQF